MSRHSDRCPAKNPKTDRLNLCECGGEMIPKPSVEEWLDEFEEFFKGQRFGEHITNRTDPMFKLIRKQREGLENIKKHPIVNDTRHLSSFLKSPYELCEEALQYDPREDI